MKINKYKTSFGLMIMIMCLIAFSCDDFITLSPISNAVEDQVYQTDEDFEQAVIGIYRSLQQQYNSFWVYGDIRADDSWAEVVKDNVAYWSDAFTMTGDHGNLNTTWSNYYTAIYRANLVLERIEVTNVENKERHIGEAKFLRALAYFDLVRMFGDVPLVTTPVSVEEGYNIGREPVTNIYNNLIIPDLQEARNLVPESYAGGDVGRATSGAAASILGRVYLTQGDFGNAESVLSEVTNMGYELLDNYNDIFDHGNPHHNEYIFDIEYQSGIGSGQGNSFSINFMPNLGSMLQLYGMTGVGDEFNSPTQHLINAFDGSFGDLRRDITIGPIGGYYHGITDYPLQDTNAEWTPMPQPTSQTYTLDRK